MYTLIIIDMQPGFLNTFDTYENTAAKHEVIEGCKRAVTQAIADGAEIIDVNYVGTDLGETISEISQLWEHYRGRVSRVIKCDDGGGVEIANNGVKYDHIMVCGINAGACVFETVRELTDLLQPGQDITIISDAVRNAWGEKYEEDLHHMQRLYNVNICANRGNALPQ